MITQKTVIGMLVLANPDEMTSGKFEIFVSELPDDYSAGRKCNV